MQYERVDDRTVRWKTVFQPTSLPVVFLARDISLSRTGLHAFVAIKAGDLQLGYTTFNVDRDEDRVRFANSCHRALGPDGADLYPASVLKRDLDRFCHDLRSQRIGNIAIEDVEGSEESGGVPPILFPWIYEEAGTILFAPPGQGKSNTVLGMMVACDAGLERTPFGTVPGPAKALYVNVERSRRSMEHRLSRVNKALGLPANRNLKMINARGRSFADVGDIVEEAVRKQGFRVVAFDSISRTGQGGLKEDETANRIIDRLNGFGCAWIGIGHTSRADETHVYGSIHFDAGADITMMLNSEKDPETGALSVRLTMQKANDVPFPRPVHLHYEFDQDGLSLIRSATVTEATSITAGRTNKDRVYAYLLEEGSASSSEIAKALDLNKGTVFDILRDRYRFVRLPNRGQVIPYGVLTPTVDPQRLEPVLGTVDPTVIRGSTPNALAFGVCSGCLRDQIEIVAYHPHSTEAKPLPLCISCAAEEAAS